MSQKLAIRGHSTRGKEVIELLEMMGGKNNCDSPADNLGLCYLIDDDFDICAHYFGYDDYEDGELNIFTLEEFLEKFPFKVGDKVNQPCRGCVKTITSMEWDEYLDTVSYKLDNKIYTRIEQLKVVNDLPYKEANMKPNKCTYCVYAVNNNHCGLRGFRSNFNVNYCSAQNVDKLPNGFELQEDGYFSWVNKKPKYPTTYAECCEVLVGRKPKPNEISFDKMELCLVDLDNTQSIDFQNPYLPQFNSLFRLRMCRDAYWKIYGEQMGLGKPWEPDLENEELYCIQNYNKQITISRTNTAFNKIIIFPTEEMRDVFFKNF